MNGTPSNPSQREPAEPVRFERALVTSSRSVPDRTGLQDAMLRALDSVGIEAVVWDGLDSSKSTPPPPDDFDLFVVFGGDGALMAAIHHLCYPSQPFFGVNHGRVGFLMNSRSTPDKLAKCLVDRTFTPAIYPVLEAALTLEDGSQVIEHAFNDVVIERASGQTAQLNAYIDDVHLNRYSGDGLIVATPGGSTAYSLAAGGPVVHHSVSAMIVTPLNPHRPVQFHSLQFPAVLSLSSVVRIENLDSAKRPVRCTLDGRSIEHVESVSIRDSGRRVELLRAPEYNFIDTLVRKVIGIRDDA